MPEELNQPDRQLEAALAQLRPAPTQLDPAAIRLAAQQRLARRQLRRWQAIAAVLALALGAALVLRPRPREVERLVYVPMPTMPTPAYIEQPKPQPPAVVDYTPMPPAPPLTHLAAAAAPPLPISPDANYLVVRQRVLEHGLDALPPSPGGGSTSPPMSLLALRQQMRLNDYSSADIRLFPWDR